MSEFFYARELPLKIRLLNCIRRLFRHPLIDRQLAALTCGRPTRSLPARLVPAAYLYQKGSWRELQRNGLRYRLDLSSHVDHRCYFGYRDEGQEWFFSLLRPHFTVLDIGANIGAVSLNLARRCPQGRVPAFEPHPDTFERLREHRDLNPGLPIEIIPCGLGRAPGRAVLHEVVDSNPGMNRILRQERADFPRREIRISTLERELSERGITEVDAIKLDVEGYELEVLQGGLELLQRCRPLLFIEVDDDNLREHGGSAAALCDLLRELGYALHHAQERRPLAPEEDFAGCHFDLLAMGKGGAR
jgi:FkbM family methyltransferase